MRKTFGILEIALIMSMNSFRNTRRRYLYDLTQRRLKCLCFSESLRDVSCKLVKNVPVQAVTQKLPLLLLLKRLLKDCLQLLAFVRCLLTNVGCEVTSCAKTKKSLVLS